LEEDLDRHLEAKSTGYHACDPPSAKIEPVYSEADLVIRHETSGMEPAIHSVNEAAFDRPDEADLVDSLRDEGVVLVSLVAELRITKVCVGHILFTRLSIETAEGSTPAVALAPLAVLPEHQRHGIWGRLIRQGLESLRQQGERIVIVLGHADYYPRFGFSCEKARLLESPFPPEAFMAMELVPGALEGIRGKVRYPAAFGVRE
jgi:putative acetyltransferase